MKKVSYENIIITIESGVYKITINRPDSHNSLSKGLLIDLKNAISDAEDDEVVRAIIITAAGNRAFCAGADLKEGFSSGQVTKMSDSLINNYNPLIKAIRNIQKPVICALNGIAAGAGCSIVLACDVVITAESASLSQIFIKIGLVPDAGSSYFLPRLVGARKAFELFSSGRIVPANECLELGLINEVVGNDELQDKALKIALSYAEAPTKAIGLIKNMINKSYNSTLDEMLALEAEYQDIASLTHDAGEGIISFLQKRKANFKGK
jgi:2-(1,2-epoxy-1,2-dihydrophenyl)acetyl-CoA isomerase